MPVLQLHAPNLHEVALRLPYLFIYEHCNCTKYILLSNGQSNLRIKKLEKTQAFIIIYPLY